MKKKEFNGNISEINEFVDFLRIETLDIVNELSENNYLRIFSNSINL